ncbi:hypothetical protein Goshw_027814 [Gossypium schwendimanii]|uniref:Ionotropic glutamate receptor C-terminal domain-containing protein n=1 Tax=Gossypium schwendimanii TaxID=34291 RepID=A0A7J9KNS7_GOSSC|nr:hypothetical protein [Gossypium schwendimanii]
MGIGMVSRLTPKENQNLWIFLKPLTPGLWLTIVGVYVLSALFIWLIERPASVERQTRQSNGEIGRVFGFSFSIFVFAHCKHSPSNLSRSVVVLWVFVVFILGSNYTATLTSMMTVQQIEFIWEEHHRCNRPCFPRSYWQSKFPEFTFKIYQAYFT